MKTKPVSPLKLDPTRTTTLRRRFLVDVRRRIAKLKLAVLEKVKVQDAFGLRSSVRNVFDPNQPRDEIGRWTKVEARASDLGRVMKTLCKGGKSPKDGGECGSVAKTLQTLLPELEAYAVVTSPSSYGYEGISHVLVSLDGDRFIDGRGVRTRKEILKAYTLKDSPKIVRVRYVKDPTSRSGGYYESEGGGVLEAGESPSLKKEIEDLLTPTDNTDWAYGGLPDKVAAFKNWFSSLVNTTILGPTNWWWPYLSQGYLRGVTRSYDDAARRTPTDPKVAAGAKQEFLRQILMRKDDPVLNESPVDRLDPGRFVARRLQALALRLKGDLENVTTTTTQRMANALTDALDQESDPEDVATVLVEQLDKVGKTRMEAVARTEVVRAFADGQLDALESLGVEGVTAAVEWTTRDGACKACKAMDGVVLSVREARGMIPRHVNCRCAWTPANESENDNQRRGRREVTSAIRRSLAATDDILEEWGPADRRLDERRPKVVRNNWLPISGSVYNASGDNCGTGAGGFKKGNTCAKITTAFVGDYEKYKEDTKRHGTMGGIRAGNRTKFLNDLLEYSKTEVGKKPDFTGVSAQGAYFKYKLDNDKQVEDYQIFRDKLLDKGLTVELELVERKRKFDPSSMENNLQYQKNLQRDLERETDGEQRARIRYWLREAKKTYERMKNDSKYEYVTLKFRD